MPPADNKNFVRQSRLYAVPPRIRALAKVIFDIDREAFPEVFTSDNSAVREEVHAISVAVGREVVSEQDWEDFNVAIGDYAQHLIGGDSESVARSGLGRLIALSTSIDKESMFTNLSTSQDLSAVYATHHFLLRLAQTEFSSRKPDVFEIFLERIFETLTEIEEIVRAMARHRSSGAATKYSPKNSVESLNASIETKAGDSAVLGALPVDEEYGFRIVALNSTLTYYIKHFEWFASVSSIREVPFDAREVIGDVSALEVWCHNVGRSVPACSVKTFLPALQTFPQWAQGPILKLLDFRSCGVISVYGLLRVLSLWGPYLLLDRNLSRDLAHCFMNLSETTEMVEARFKATKPPTGTTCMTLAAQSGAFDLQLMTAKGNVRKLLVDQSTGSWVLQGVSKEDYEAPTDICLAFKHIFSVPAGEKYDVPVSTKVAVNETFSILHRACFKNNISYVANLIERGNGVIVNSSVVDPSITSALSWTPLLASVNNPNGDPVEICRMLIGCGAELMKPDEATCTAFYYAIVNRYTKSAALIIQECQAQGLEPRTSDVTIPLLVAMGAHAFNSSDSDNHRLEHLLPDVNVIKLLLPITTDLRVARAAYQILWDKLSCNDTQRDCPELGLAGDRPSNRPNDHSQVTEGWNFGKFPCPTLTNDEAVKERGAIARHTMLCYRHEVECREVLKVIGAHCYLLSARQLINSVRQQD